MTTCPLCDQAVEWTETVHFDLNSNMLVSFGRTVRLRPTEAEILWLLRERAPRFVRTESIVQAVDPLGDMSEKSVQVHVCRIRKLLAGLPWTIKSVQGLGYKFALQPEAGS